MPIREFICSLGHVTEKIVSGEDDELDTIQCEARGITPHCGPNCKPDDPDHACRLEAVRIDIPSRYSFRLMPGGSGGFYSPSKG